MATKTVLEIALDTLRANTTESPYSGMLYRAFDAPDVVSDASFPFAGDAIRRHLKTWYLDTVDVRRLHVADVHEVMLGLKRQFSSVSPELERAIDDSRAILDIPADPEEGIIAYSEQTWRRATDLLRALANTSWETNAEMLPVPSIAPTLAGSIDLFWEQPNLSLLVNVPADPNKNATFFGRRLQYSKISGTLDNHDVRPGHLTAWLAGREWRAMASPPVR